VPNPPALESTIENQIEWTALIQHFGGLRGCLISRVPSMSRLFAVERLRQNAPSGASTLMPCLMQQHRGSATESTVLADIAPTVVRLSGSNRTRKTVRFGSPAFRLNERLAVQQGLFLYLYRLIPFMQSLAQRSAASRFSFCKHRGV